MRFDLTRDKAAATIAVVYLASLPAPALHTAIISRAEFVSVDPMPTWYGIEILLIGWTHMLAPGGIAWLGNPILFAGLWLMVNQSRHSFWVSAVGLTLVLMSFALRGVFADRALSRSMLN